MKLKPKNTTLNQRALVYRRYNQIVDSNSLNTLYKTFDNKLWVFDGISKLFKEVSDAEITPITNVIVVSSSVFYKYQNFYFKYITYNGATFWQETEVDKEQDYVGVKLYANDDPFYADLGDYISDEIEIKEMLLNGFTMVFKNKSLQPIYFSVLYAGAEETSELIQPDETFEISTLQDALIESVKVSGDTQTDVDFSYSFEASNGLSTQFPQLSNIAKYQKNAYYYAGSFSFMLRGSVSGSTSQYIKGNIVPLTSMNIKYFDDSMSLQVDDLVVVDGKLYSVENPETDFKFQPKGYKIHFVTLNSIL